MNFYKDSMENIKNVKKKNLLSTNCSLRLYQACFTNLDNRKSGWCGVVVIL